MLEPTDKRSRRSFRHAGCSATVPILVESHHSLKIQSRSAPYLIACGSPSTPLSGACENGCSELALRDVECPLTWTVPAGVGSVCGGLSALERRYAELPDGFVPPGGGTTSSPPSRASSMVACCLWSGAVTHTWPAKRRRPAIYALRRAVRGQGVTAVWSDEGDRAPRGALCMYHLSPSMIR
jgi:hypothetical protein